MFILEHFLWPLWECNPLLDIKGFRLFNFFVQSASWIWMTKRNFLLSENAMVSCNVLSCEFHTGMTFWFPTTFTWWQGHLISKSQTLRMHYPFQSTSRLTSHQNRWSFHVYMIPLQDSVLEWNSCPSTTTGVNSRQGDSCRHHILWWYHVNKYRVMRGNWRWTRTVNSLLDSRSSFSALKPHENAS